MKPLALIFAATIGLAMTICNTQAGDHWLKAGWFYADSKEDIQKATRFSIEEDRGAIGQMERENKLSVSSDTELQVYLVDVPFLSGWVAFHFKGSSTAYWTYLEALSDKAPVVQPAAQASGSSVTASSTPATAEDQKAATARVAKDAADYKKNIKSGKWKEFKNGE